MQKIEVFSSELSSPSLTRIIQSPSKGGLVRKSELLSCQCAVHKVTPQVMLVFDLLTLEWLPLSLFPASLTQCPQTNF